MKSRGKLHSTRGLARPCCRDVAFSYTVCSTSDLADGKFGDDLCLGRDKMNYVSLIFVFWVDFRIASREPM